MSVQGLVNFNQYCRDHSTWIIKYSSINYPTPIYLIWYNNVENNHRPTLLTFQNGEIFITSSLQSLIKIHTYPPLMCNEQLKVFVNGLTQFQSITCTYFDMIDIILQLNQSDYTLQNLLWVNDFIQLVNDYRTTWPAIRELENIFSYPSIENMQQYFHDHILLPHFQGQAIAQTTLENLPIQHNDLIQFMEKTMHAFETCFSKNNID